MKLMAVTTPSLGVQGRHARSYMYIAVAFSGLDSCARPERMDVVRAAVDFFPSCSDDGAPANCFADQLIPRPFPRLLSCSSTNSFISELNWCQ